jgi:hypothetical protein
MNAPKFSSILLTTPFNTIPGANDANSAALASFNA